MTQITQNYDNNYGRSPVTRQMTPGSAVPQAVRIPDYYAPNDKKSFKESLEKNPIYSMVIKGFFGPLIDHPIASLFTWFGCSFLLNKYTDACGGEYDKSLLKKVVNFGDNIENSKFIKSKPVQKILSFFKKGGNKIDNVVENNSVLSAIKNTPTLPEWEMVKQEMIPQRQRVVEDFNHIANTLHLGDSEGFARLNDLDVSKKETKELKEFFKAAKLSEIPEEQASSYIQLKRIKKSDEFIKKALLEADGGISITKDEILKKMGQNAEWIKKVREDSMGKCIAEVQEATKRVGDEVKIGLGKASPFGINLGVLTKPGERTLSCSNVHNRLYSLAEGAKTKTGRFMAKFMQLVHRGLTFGGGKYGVLLFIAPAFVETAINVHKAEPKEKVGTCVSNLTNHISWVFTFPIALQMMHHLCGAQYAGMKKEDIQKIRELQTKFNEKNKNQGFKTVTEYNEANKAVNAAIKKLKTVENQKWYTKFIRKLAGVITPDLGRLDAYNPGNFAGRKLFQLRNLPRNLWGVPVRLVLFGVLTMGVLDAIINKTIKLIFGGSYDSMKEEEQKDAKKEQKEFLKEDLNDRLYALQKQKIVNAANAKRSAQNNSASGNNIAHRGGSPQMNSYTQEQPVRKAVEDTYSYIPSQENIIKSPLAKGKSDTYTYIPSQDSTLPNAKNENMNNTKRSYIPSQAGANIQKSWDNSGLQSALDRAQRAENRAIKILSGNFEGMN